MLRAEGKRENAKYMPIAEMFYGFGYRGAFDHLASFLRVRKQKRGVFMLADGLLDLLNNRKDQLETLMIEEHLVHLRVSYRVGKIYHDNYVLTGSGRMGLCTNERAIAESIFLRDLRITDQDVCMFMDVIGIRRRLGRGEILTMDGRLKRMMDFRAGMRWLENMPYGEVVFSDRELSIVAPVPGQKVDITSAMLKLDTRYMLPLYDPTNHQVTPSCFSACIDNEKKTITFSSRTNGVIVCSLLAYERVYYEGKSLVGGYVMKQSFGSQRGDLNFVRISRNKRSMWVRASILASCKVAIVDNYLDLDKAYATVRWIGENVREEDRQFILDFAMHLVALDIFETFPKVEGRTWWFWYIISRISLGLGVQSLSQFFFSLFSNFQAFFGIVDVYDCEMTCTHLLGERIQGLGDIQTILEVGAELKGEAFQLVEDLSNVNGYKTILTRVHTRYMSLTDLPEICFGAPERRYDPIAAMKILTNEINPSYMLLGPEYLEYIVNTGGPLYPDPDVLKLKHTLPENMLHTQRKLHLPKCPMMDQPRKASYNSIMRAICVRNLGVAHQNFPLDYRRLFDENLPRIARCLFRHDWRERSRQWREDFPVTVNSMALSRWVKNMQANGKLKRYLLGEKVSLEQADYSDFQVILRTNIKSQTTYDKIPEPQTVFFLGQQGASAQAVFEELSRRWKEIQRINVFSTDGLSEQDIEDRYNDLLPRGVKLRSIQRDLSKYDKSLGHVPHGLERCVFEILGAKKEFLDDWFSSNETIMGRFVGLYFKIQVAEQRRSGIPNTLLSNDIVNTITEVIVAELDVDVPEHDFYIMQKQGDDIDILVPEEFKLPVGVSQRSADLFNLIEKRLETTRTYICSRYVIPVNGRFRVVYDPFKMVAKFNSALKPEEYQKLDERYISYRVLVRGYDEVGVRAQMPNAHYEMYGKEPNHVLVMMDAAMSAMTSCDTFINMWESYAVQR
jgi:hypothetical protein